MLFVVKSYREAYNTPTDRTELEHEAPEQIECYIQSSSLSILIACCSPNNVFPYDGKTITSYLPFRIEINTFVVTKSTLI